MTSYRIENGVPAQHRRMAAELHFDAFAGKLGRILGPRDKGCALFERMLDPDFAISAVSPDGALLLGVAGFKTAEGGLFDGKFGDLRESYGVLGSLWRGLALSALDRPVEADCLLMDGIAVASDHRGSGVGSALLDAICSEASRRGKAQVRLDVIDSNPKARALYERLGFVAGQVTVIGPLRHVFGFESATTMLKRVNSEE